MASPSPSASTRCTLSTALPCQCFVCWWGSHQGWFPIAASAACGAESGPINPWHVLSTYPLSVRPSSSQKVVRRKPEAAGSTCPNLCLFSVLQIKVWLLLESRASWGDMMLLMFSEHKRISKTSWSPTGGHFMHWHEHHTWHPEMPLLSSSAA